MSTDAAVGPLPHHDGSPLHVSTLTPQLGDEVAVRLRVPEGYRPLAAVRIRSNPDHEPHWDEARPLGSVDGWQWWQGSTVVRNPRHGYRFLLEHADGTIEWLNQTGVHRTETLDAEDFALVAGNEPPAWLGDAVMYQVFPDRFARSASADVWPAPDWALPAQWHEPVDAVPPGRSQQFYGGDLDGILDHLDHLDELGVTLIYLTPIFPGASNHRYDAASFSHVDPLLGGDEALVRLVQAAHARGIRVIGDLTSNHSGHRHEWFESAFRQPHAPESGFYYFEDADNERYNAWLGVPSLPKFNWKSGELRRRFIEGPESIVGRWLQPPFELDGWRIDVANMTGRLGAEDLNAEVRQLIRRTMQEVDRETILLAESTNDAASDFQGDAWHGAMTYPAFTRPVWGWLSEPARGAWFFGQPTGGIPQYTGEDLVQMQTRFTAGLPWRVRLGSMNALDTHDTARFATHARPGTVPVAVGLAVTLPGIPVVFAGDEFGLVGEDGEASRSPIPWDRSEQPEVAERTALYRDLIALRHAHPALATGGLRWLHVGEDALVYVRESVGESVLCVAARGPFSVTVTDATLPGLAAAKRLYGDVALEPVAGGVALGGAGPSFAAWRLPPLRVPEEA
ncbi:alpha-amylase family glycosyl hydrolase [Rathayibacter sp. YIM 133350]|uniref:alpha-amylase family glycosyl hydrolase n=1 Tax=Rathayibacter sp. YIM 133350 TaxID=3131992 RepID=UPI00307EA9FF